MNKTMQNDQTVRTSGEVPRLQWTTQNNVALETLTEQMCEKVYHLNCAYIEQGAPCFRLIETLEKKNVTALRKLGRLYQIRGFSRMDKATLLEKLCQTMVLPDCLSPILLSLNDLQWSLLTKAVHLPSVRNNLLLAEHYLPLIHAALLSVYYVDGHFHYVVPTEIRIAYCAVEKTGLPAQKEHTLLLNRYAMAMTNLYGFISNKEFVEIFDQQNAQSIDPKDLKALLSPYIAMGYPYCFWNAYIVNADLAENDFADLPNYIQAAAQKPRYLPQKKQLLRYRLREYAEPIAQAVILRNFICSHLMIDQAAADQLLHQIVYCTKSQLSPQGCIALLGKCDVSLSLEQIQLLIPFMMDLYNHTRLWIHKGYTPTELQKIQKKQSPALSAASSSTQKVGRNDPCPCGSGKKYKRCCAR